MTRSRAVALVVVAAAVVAAGGWAAGSGLPSPIAVHWSLAGHPDGSASHAVGLALAPLLVLLLGIAAAYSGEVASPALAWAVASGAVLQAMLVVANRGHADWHRARVAPVALLLVVGVPLAVAALVARVVPPPAVSGDAPSLGLRAGERAAWHGEARNALLLWAGAALGVAALAVRPPRWPVLLFVALALVDCALVRVSVSAERVRVALGPWGWPRLRVRTADVVRATAEDVRPMANGGWGYRGSRRLFKRAAVVVRGGEGLVLALRDGTRLVVTVDDAETAAGLVNDLAARTAPATPADR